jgi:hypothetical protein
VRLERVFVTLPVHHVRRLLHAIVRHLEAGLSRDEVEKFCALLEGEHEWNDLIIEPIVRFEGQELPFIVDVLDEESDMFEIVFTSPPAISQIVLREIQLECSEITPKVIPAHSNADET